MATHYNAYLLDKEGNQIFYKDKPDLSKGDLYISVSQILSMQGGGDFLITWALKEFGGQLDPIGAHKEYMNRVSDLGSRLHKWVEYDLKNLKFPDAELKEDMIRGIESWDAFKASHEIELIDSERVLFSRTYRFGGTMDLRLKVDGQAYVADLKTGSVQSKAFIQLSAYKHMLQEMGLSDGSEKLLVLGGADSKSKIADGGKVMMHTLDTFFKGGSVTEQDLFVRLMCLRELWYQENVRSRKWEPVIKGMAEYIDPIVVRFKDSFQQHAEEAKQLKRKKKNV
jgi:hypothetical protein